MRVWMWLLRLGTIPILAAIVLINAIHFGIHDTPWDMGSLDAGINSINMLGVTLLNLNPNMPLAGYFTRLRGKEHDACASRPR